MTLSYLKHICVSLQFPISHLNSDYLKIESVTKPTKEPWNKGVDKSQIAEKIEVMFAAE